MIHRRYASAASMIDDDHWWVTGGWGDSSALTTSEIYVGGVEDAFYEDVDLPVDLYHHNLVRINDTHHIMLGGDTRTSQSYFFS